MENSKQTINIENKNLNQDFNSEYEEWFLDEFIADFHFDEESYKIIESKENKLFLMTKRDIKNEEIYKLKKDDMRKKTREKQKQNKFKKKKEKYHMLKHLTDGQSKILKIPLY